MKSSEVWIDLGARSYPITIGDDLLDSVGQIVKDRISGQKAMVVTNPTVGSLYGEKIKKQLERIGVSPVMAEIPDGEEHKSLSTANVLYDLAYRNELDRRSPIIALGGGVVGDLSGFVAATYLRGVPFIQIPTTLLAQVDSSVGGKVAVNHPRGKNIIGAFYQPSAVVADLSVLKTLPEREIRAGMAEVIKYGVIADHQFFCWLEDNLQRVLNLDPSAMEKVITVSCKIKAAVVREDETEQGIRAVLNYGHTVGHAVEALTGYTVYRHGEAVAIGMVTAAEMAVRMGLLDQQVAARIAALLERTGLPVQVPDYLDKEDLIHSMQKDKKVISSKLTFVLPVAMGTVEIFRDVDKKIVHDCLQ